MLIDCGTCAVRGDACADCVVTFLTIPVRSEQPDAPAAAPRPAAAQVLAPGLVAGPLGAEPSAVDLDDAERGAIEVLAASGLVPPLRMVRAV